MAMRCAVLVAFILSHLTGCDPPKGSPPGNDNLEPVPAVRAHGGNVDRLYSRWDVRYQYMVLDDIRGPEPGYLVDTGSLTMFIPSSWESVSDNITIDAQGNDGYVTMDYLVVPELEWNVDLDDDSLLHQMLKTRRLQEYLNGENTIGKKISSVDVSIRTFEARLDVDTLSVANESDFLLQFEELARNKSFDIARKLLSEQWGLIDRDYGFKERTDSDADAYGFIPMGNSHIKIYVLLVKGI